MKSNLGIPNPDRFHMINSPFETLQLPSVTFDVIFTGPPYFDYEIYGDGTNQSIVTFSSATDWIVHFLFFCIRKSWMMLEDEGVLALNVNDTHDAVRRGISYTEAMVLFAVSQLDQCSYEGVICFTGANFAAPRPIWVFKKTATVDLSRKVAAEKLLETHYPEIWKLSKESQKAAKTSDPETKSSYETTQPAPRKDPVAADKKRRREEDEGEDEDEGEEESHQDKKFKKG